jgi:hypothetical protein
MASDGAASGLAGLIGVLGGFSVQRLPDFLEEFAEFI